MNTTRATIEAGDDLDTLYTCVKSTWVGVASRVRAFGGESRGAESEESSDEDLSECHFECIGLLHESLLVECGDVFVKSKLVLLFELKLLLLLLLLLLLFV
jgi:hypothetical protein